MDKRKLLENMIVYRVPNYNVDFPIILFWSQKSGCTTLLKWFFFQLGLLDEAQKYNPWIHYYEEEVYKSSQTYKQEVIDCILTEKKETMKLVRNPYKRAVSQFLILASTKGMPYWEKEWEKIREFFYNDKNSKRGITFKQFLIYIRDYPGVIDDHFKPQYMDGEELFVKNYIYLESFTSEISAIERKYKLKKSNLSKLTYSSHHLKKSMILDGKFSNLEITNETFSENRKLPTYDSFYNNETTNLVNSIFKNDFMVYEYKMQ
ncbi:sulfotransferase family 2 domain-containing protein [Bacillus sp. J33]|uniref:sulfotransferase family 2 domain-containing protein n=1 Tax=Bacillus sp. J33 TaxID=935836 RepID=UPI00047D8BF2|nr:sulfotransferase family 2 domain-containing protein [Bacillus sp. J33]